MNVAIIISDNENILIIILIKPNKQNNFKPILIEFRQYKNVSR